MALLVGCHDGSLVGGLSNRVPTHRQTRIPAFSRQPHRREPDCRIDGQHRHDLLQIPQHPLLRVAPRPVSQLHQDQLAQRRFVLPHQIPHPLRHGIVPASQIFNLRRRIHQFHFTTSHRPSSRIAFKSSKVMKFGSHPLSRSASAANLRRRLNSLTATSTASARLLAPVFFTTALSSPGGISIVVFMRPTIADAFARFNPRPICPSAE